MFFISSHDRTVCFHCVGGLTDWFPTDDPWRNMQPGISSAFTSDILRVQLTFVNARIYGCRQKGKEGEWYMPTATCCRL